MENSRPKVIYINGGTGFVGRALCAALLQHQDKYRLMVQTRRPSHHRHNAITFLHSYHELPEGVSPDVLINLSGASIADGRWTPARRRELINSRVRVTQELFDGIAERGDAPQLLINASAVGFYGPRADETITETDEKGKGFATELCEAWEAEAFKFKDLGSRVVVLRIGVVLGQGGGMMKKLVPIYKLGLGGTIGRGQQWMSWIHIDDLIQMMLTVIHDQRYSGAYNATSPNPVQQREFSRSLAKKLHRPAFIYTSKMLLRILFGDMADELLINGQRVVPAESEKLGFTFKYPDIRSALENILPS